MKIAIIGQLPGPVSANGPGGTEVFVHNLIEKLRENDVDVKLFASSDSSYPALTHPFYSSDEISAKEALSDFEVYNKTMAYKQALFLEVVKNASSFDLIHNNTFETYLFFPFSQLTPVPTVHTAHHNIFESPSFGTIAERYMPKKDILVFVAERTLRASKGQYQKTFIHNGINTDLYAFQPAGGQNIVWISRPVKKKGLDTAVQVASLTKQPIDIVTNTNNQEQESYLAEILNQYPKTNKTVWKNKAVNERVNIIGKSRVFLFPFDWEEVFPLVVLESLSTGTPVVSFARGSVTEMIKDGETGFIINQSAQDIRGDFVIKKIGVEGLKEAIERIYSLPETEYREVRKACRLRAQEFFSLDKMTEKYLKLYRKIIQDHANSKRHP